MLSAHNVIMYVYKLTSFLINMQKTVCNSDNKCSNYKTLVLVTVFINTLYFSSFVLAASALGGSDPLQKPVSQGYA